MCVKVITMIILVAQDRKKIKINQLNTYKKLQFQLFKLLQHLATIRGSTQAKNIASFSSVG